MKELDVVVVGAGQAGLAVSYFLQRAGLEHVVLERGRIGETWLSQRWDSFRLNTPNFINALPGLPYEGAEPDGFWSNREQVRYFERYVDHWHLPVRTGATVASVERAGSERQFIVRVKKTDGAEESASSRAVVAASGIQHTPKFPPIHNRMPGDIMQIHTAEYRSPAQLPPGSVLIVGGGQSGVQIAEDLLPTGRTIYLATSRVGRVPRRYRGRDILEWWIDSGFLDVTFDSLEDKAIARAAQPHASGLGRYGHSVSLQHLARQGVVLLGRVLDIEADTLILDDDVTANVRFADEFSRRQKDGVDAYLARAGITPPPIDDDPADRPDPQAESASPLRRLDLRDARVATVIWATGFTGDFSWLHLPVLDPDGKPIHQQGVAPVPGLYFVGFPWLRSRKSGIIYGVAEDAQYIAGAIVRQLGS